MKRIHLLRPGTFSSNDGTSFTFSAANLAAIAKNYDPARGEAPLTLGHPKTDHPAFGWVERLEFDAGTGNLYAVPKQVAPEFADAVSRGAFKKISVALFGPNQPANPKPGDYYIRHVGFLGGHVPAVPGLSPVEFAAAADAEVSLEFDAPTSYVASVFRRLREFLIGDKGLDVADQVVPDYVVSDLEAQARMPDDDAGADAASGSMFSASSQESSMSNTTQAALDQRQAELDARAAELAALETSLTAKQAEFAAAAAATRRQAITVEVDAAIAAGRVLPAERGLMVELAARCGDGETIEFAAADGSTQSINLFEGWKQLLKSLPSRVTTGEIARGEQPSASSASFAAPAGHAIDSERLDLHNRALDYQKAHQGVSYEEAVSACERG